MMLIEKFKKNFEVWISPFILLGICVAAFGLQIFWLGYTLDDWIILYSYYSGGISELMEYSFQVTRPLIYWTWFFGFKLLGTSPLNWQIWAIFWRFITILVFWLVIRNVWPEHPRKTMFMALLFTIYPVFFQQHSALTYSSHWICFALFMISIYLMIKAISGKGNFLLFSALSIFTGGLSLYSKEFFIGLEMIRIILIWKFIYMESYSHKNRIKKTLVNWLPYLLLVISFLVWRFVFMPTPGSDRNTPQLLINFFQTPIKTLFDLFVIAIRDLINTLLGVWYHTYKPEVIAIQPMSVLFSWILAGIVFLSLLIIFLKFKFFNENIKESSKFETYSIYFGLLTLILGLLPGWVIERSISDPNGLFNDRFGLAAMPGVSILLVGIIVTIIKIKRIQIIILCLLIALASGQHFRSASEYRWSWEEQLRLLWQLKWRMPEIQSPTAIYGDGALIKFMGSWATISAFNTAFPSENRFDLEPFWYFDLTRTNIRQSVENDQPVRDSKTNLNFFGKANDSIVIQTEALPLQCVWILDSMDADNPFLTSEVRYALPLSNFEKISLLTESTLDPEIFGPEISHDWCYYFQKADLAYQYEEWDTIIDLWHEAEINGLNPYNGPELIMFIQAAANVGNWELALDLTQKATFLTEDVNDYLCLTWEKIYLENNTLPGLNEPIHEIDDQYNCRILQN